MGQSLCHEHFLTESRISICISLCVSYPNIIFCKIRRGRKNLRKRVELNVGVCVG